MVFGTDLTLSIFLVLLGILGKQCMPVGLLLVKPFDELIRSGERTLQGLSIQRFCYFKLTFSMVVNESQTGPCHE